MAENPPRRRVPLPGRLLGTGARSAEAVARAAGIDQVVEAAVAEALVRLAESQPFDDAVERVLRGPAVEEAVAAAIRSPAVERALSDALDSEMVDRLWARLLASDEAQKLVERIAEAPEVRAAITEQGVGLIEDLARGARLVARRLDDAVERVARRVLRRPQREGSTNCAGAVSRLLALAVDGAIVNVALLGISALVRSLIDALSAGNGGSADVTIAAGAVAWILAGGAYLIGFWALIGRTPGMRFLAITLHDFDDDRRIGARAARRRLLALLLGVMGLGLGLRGVITDERRRAWHDRRAGTEVHYDVIGDSSAPHSKGEES